jgi:poly(A) polymerase
VLPRLYAGRPGRFARTELFELAVEVALADVSARGEPTEALERLRPPREVRRRREPDGRASR